VIQAACNMDRQGPSVLADLLLTQTESAPRLPDVSAAELISTTIWYVWWERRQVLMQIRVLERQLNSA
jgi:hypothetical protein